LRAGVRDEAIQRGLACFLAYCADHAIPPEAMDEETFRSFQAWLEQGTLVPKPAALYRRLVVQWNWAVAGRKRRCKYPAAPTAALAA
jgi:hypothetical protein